MTTFRAGRQKYYDIFSHFYDLFIRLHAYKYRDETRKFLVDSAGIKDKRHPKVLDVCCGTGSVILSFTKEIPDILAVGYDFSHGMLHKAKEKVLSHKVSFIMGNAASMSFADNSFDIVCCSHALYELKGADRKKALMEMRRVVKPNGKVLIMEHEIPKKRLVKILFYIRMFMMGPKDSREFLKKGITPFKEIYSSVTLAHTGSGKSKLFICRK